ncbi:MazG-like family protein [Haladaptatus halobius]|uniref:MazG-like family protein n=1 Tax=Haladaptatus halobius TaxID=2884875 RepID=UPI001D0A4253|nr:MazG-like family protein [Haladaptatus halobius]
MEEQQKVAEFITEHDLQTPPEFRLLDLVSELGEVAKNATESTNYGDHPKQLDVEADEIGDVLFSLLAVAESLDINAGEALDQSLVKYGERIEEKDSPSSGE